MNAYSRKHTPVPRPCEPGGIISKSEKERSEASLKTWFATPDEIAALLSKYQLPSKGNDAA